MAAARKPPPKPVPPTEMVPRPLYDTLVAKLFSRYSGLEYADAMKVTQSPTGQAILNSEYRAGHLACVAARVMWAKVGGAPC